MRLIQSAKVIIFSLTLGAALTLGTGLPGTGLPFVKGLPLGASLLRVAANSSATPVTQSAPEQGVTLSGNEIGDDLPVTRAQAAKMIALAYSSKNEIDSLDREIEFSDTDVSKWYDRYINAVYIEGYMKGYENRFRPDETLSIQEAQQLINSIYPANKLKIQMTEETRSKPISYALWTKLFIKTLENQSSGTIYDTFGVEGRNVIVLATPESNRLLTNSSIITDKGAFSAAGYKLEPFIDKEIRIFYRDGEIIAPSALISDTPTIRNAYIVSSGVGGVTIFSGGAERRYDYPAALSANGAVCDIRISGRTATAIDIYDKKTTGTVKKISRTELFLPETGALGVDEDFKVYSIAGGKPMWRAMKDITVGSDICEFYMKDGRVCAGVITKKAVAGVMRVALNTTGFAGLIHKDVRLTSNTDFTVSAGGASKTYKAGQIFTASEYDTLKSAGRVFITPVAAGGKIEIKSISRNLNPGESPKYRGTIEIGVEPGGYSIVNELGMEQYLYAVIPSEMPLSFGVEALKVQAVTSRSFAYNQFYANGYYKYGAHVDDSVMSQVYNNTPEAEASIKAADETAGLCLTYNGNVINANFFSTSSGVTANSGEVWATSTGQFPAQTPEYLRADRQYVKVGNLGADILGDLTKNENAAAFFKSTDVEAPDSGYPWFRWTTEMTLAEITASVNANLKARYDASPALIKTLQPNNVYRSRAITTVGNVKSIEITKRGESGNIMEMIIRGDAATVLVKTEYNVRTLVRPVKYLKDGRDIPVTRKDASVVNNFNLMPSAFYTAEPVKNDSGTVTGYKFFGGGYGHGVGLSQNGVKGLIDNGYTYERIFGHFFSGAEIKQMY